AGGGWDRGREGGVGGEGGGVVVLEPLDHAARRGARAYVEIIGFGSAWGPPAGGQGLSRAARAALDEAGIGAEAIDHVNAHGVSTLEGDIAEAAGLDGLQDRGSPMRLFAARSYFGDLGAGAGI